MAPELDDTNCLLTAASKGLGRAAASALVDASARVTIANIVSATAPEPKAGDVSQAALRPGIYGISKSLANEYGPEGVRVNCVCPRGITTERLAEKIDYLAETEGVSYEEAAYITGETIALDGGWSRGAF